MLRALTITGLILISLHVSADIIGDVIEGKLDPSAQAGVPSVPAPAPAKQEKKSEKKTAVKTEKKPPVQYTYRFECSDKILKEGEASIYGLNNGSGDSSNQRLATPGRLNVKALTAAMLKPVALYSWVQVTNKRTKRSTYVQILDRGPYAKKRVIDLTPAAGCAIDIPCTGRGSVAQVIVRACKRIREVVPVVAEVY